MAQGVENAVEAVGQAVENAVEAVAQGVENAVEAVAQGVESAVVAVAQGVENAVEAVAQGVENSVESVAQGYTALDLHHRNVYPGYRIVYMVYISVCTRAQNCVPQVYRMVYPHAQAQSCHTT